MREKEKGAGEKVKVVGGEKGNGRVDTSNCRYFNSSVSQCLSMIQGF